MRDPAIHIRRSSLVEVLGKIGVHISEKEAVELVRAARSFQIKNRYLVTTNSKTKKKLDRSLEADTMLAEKFNRVLHACRQMAGHKYISMITKADSSYVTLKEVALAADDFSTIFKINPPEEGYKKYVNIGLKLIGKKYSLAKFKYYKDKIFNVYESLMGVDSDPTKERTLAFYDCWREYMLHYTSLDKSLNELEMIHMVYGKQEADEAGAYHDDWIEAQFEELVWLNAVPELTQLYGENAKKRWEKHMTKLNRPPKDEVMEGIAENYEDPEQAEYFALMREKRAGK